MSNKGKGLVWEEVRTSTRKVSGLVVDPPCALMARARVPGGWLVRYEDESHLGRGIGLTFMPDPDHSWKPGLDSK